MVRHQTRSLNAGTTKSSFRQHVPNLETNNFLIWNLVFRPLVKSAYQKFNFLIYKPKYMLWVLKRTVSMRGSFEHPKHMLQLMGKKIFTILLSKNVFI